MPSCNRSFAFPRPTIAALRRLSDVTRVPQSELMRAAMTLLLERAVEHGFLLADDEYSAADIRELPLCLRAGTIPRSGPTVVAPAFLRLARAAGGKP